jgi:hypothetical protein
MIHRVDSGETPGVGGVVDAIDIGPRSTGAGNLYQSQENPI